MRWFVSGIIIHGNHVLHHCVPQATHLFVPLVTILVETPFRVWPN